MYYCIRRIVREKKQRRMTEEKSWLYLIWSRCVNNFRVVWNFSEESTRKHRIPSRFQTMTMLTSEMEIWMINEDMNYVWLEKSSTEDEKKKVFFTFFWRAGSRKEKKTSWCFKNCFDEFQKMDGPSDVVCVLQLNDLQVQKRISVWVASCLVS